MLSLSAPSHKKGCLGFQNMLFVQPQRRLATCRATGCRVDRPAAGHARGREETWRHGRVAARQSLETHFAAQVGELNSFPLNLKIGLSSWNVSHLLLSGSAAEQKTEGKVAEGLPMTWEGPCPDTFIFPFVRPE